MIKSDRIWLGLLILRAPKRRVGVKNGGTTKGKYVKSLPFPQLSKEASDTDTFKEFPTLLMSVGRTADDSNVSIFNKKDVKEYKEKDVVSTFRGTPILIGRRDERGRYRIPLMKTPG